MESENEQQVDAETMDDPFGFTLDKLHADAIATVENPVVRAAIERVKQGHAAQGFKNMFDKTTHDKTR